VGAFQPVAGRHYPRSTGEFQAWFGTDADCLDYLAWLRWPEGLSARGVGIPVDGRWPMVATSAQAVGPGRR
jgi:hypothetical protein